MTNQKEITSSLTDLKQVAQRITDRLAHGMIEEVQTLMTAYSEKEWLSPAFSATGYKEVRAYLEGRMTKEQLCELWLRREVQYAKRQLTWWKKKPRVIWFDVTQDNWRERALQKMRDHVY